MQIFLIPTKDTGFQIKHYNNVSYVHHNTKLLIKYHTYVFSGAGSAIFSIITSFTPFDPLRG